MAKSFGLWVADEEILLDHAGQIEDFVCDWLEPSVNQFQPRDFRPTNTVGESSWGLPLPCITYRQRPRLKFNQLYWPSGANRYSEMYVLCTQQSAIRILRQAWSSTIGFYDNDLIGWPAENQNLTYRYSEPVDLQIRHPDLTVDVPMYVLDYRILGGGMNQSRTTKFAVLRLADERFFWQQMGFGGQCVGRPATGPPSPSFPSRYPGDTWWTWGDLFTELFASVHVTSENYEISGDFTSYNYPDPVEFNRPFASVGALLDAAALSTGMRISRDLTGTTRVHTPADAWTHASTLTPPTTKLSGMPADRIAGGWYRPGPRFARLLVAFPKIIQGHIDETDRWYWTLIQNNLGHTDDYATHEVFDDSSYTWSAMLNETINGVPGVNEVVYTTHHAFFDPADSYPPENWTDIQAHVRRIFRDRALWTEREAQWRLCLPAADPWHVSALDDYVLYDFGTEQQRDYELHFPDQGADDAKPPSLREMRNKKLTTLRVGINEDQHSRFDYCQDQVAWVQGDHAYFKMTEVLHPGSYADAKWVEWNDSGGTWDEITVPDSMQFDIYDPYHRAFALIGEVVRCEWDAERKRWEVAEVRGLRREVVVVEVGGISAGATGTAEIWVNGAVVSPQVTIEVDLKWMDMNIAISENKEIAVWYNRDEERWIIDGSEC